MKCFVSRLFFLVGVPLWVSAALHLAIGLPMLIVGSARVKRTRLRVEADAGGLVVRF